MIRKLTFSGVFVYFRKGQRTRILRDKKTGTLPLHPPNKCKRNKGIITVLAENSPMFIVVLKSNCAITTIVL